MNTTEQEDTSTPAAVEDVSLRQDVQKLANKLWRKMQQMSRLRKVLTLILVLIIVALAVYGNIRFHSFPADSRYIWPASQEDWAAWGTWVSATGAIAAVIYASRSIKHAIEAQRGTERQLKADRQHDRNEREKERQLVREEREALKKESDRIALVDANRLKFTYNSNGKPDDSEYANVQYERYLKAHEGNIDHPTEDAPITKAYVLVTNSSHTVAFNDLSLWVREKGVTVSSVEERDAPPDRDDDDLEGDPPVWKAAAQGTCNELAQNQWSLGSIRPRQQLLVTLSLPAPIDDLEWEPVDLWTAKAQEQNIRKLVLGYRDPEKRHWVRSTETLTGAPQRLLYCREIG